MLGDLRFLHACCCRSGFIHMREVSPAHGRSVGIWSTSRVQWLAGMEVVNHHTLSDFRIAHGSALQNLMEQVIGVLLSEGLVGLERVTQDGTKIRAQARNAVFSTAGASKNV